MSNPAENEHYYDYMEEQYMSELYEEHKKEAIEEFTVERLQSYFLANKLLAKPAVAALSQARTLVTANATAGLLFSVIAIEVGLKTTLLKPIVYGLVHTDSIAALITDLTVSHTGMDRYRGLLLQILQEHGGVDLENYKRLKSNKTLWEETKEVQKLRNAMMHRAETVSEEQADLALCVGSEILERIFPSVVEAIGLHLHDGYRICDDWKCKYQDILPRGLTDVT